MYDLAANARGRPPQLFSGAASFIGRRRATQNAAAFLASLSPELWVDASSNYIVQASERVSQMTDRSANGRHILQATGSAQPYYLPHTGTNYLWVPLGAANGNHATQPDSPGLYPSGGQLSVICLVALDALLAAAIQSLFQHGVNATTLSWQFVTTTTGGVQFAVTYDGITVVTQTSSVTLQSVGVQDKQWVWLMATADTNLSSNNLFYYYATYNGNQNVLPTAWTQLGITRSIASGTLYDSAAVLSVGARSSGTFLMDGKVGRAVLYSGILDEFGNGGTMLADFNPGRFNENDTTGTDAANGQTWTVNSTGLERAQIVGAPFIYTDGAAMFMRTTYTRTQPRTTYVVGRNAVFTAPSAGVQIGGETSEFSVRNGTSTPRLALSTAAADVATNSDWANMGMRVGAFQFDSTGLIQIGSTGTPTTGALAAGNTNGITLGADHQAVPGNFAPAQIRAIYERAGADDSLTRAGIMRALGQLYGVAA